MLQNITAKYLELDSFDLPNIEITGNEKDILVREYKMII